jgi:hypothetical protein
MKSQLVKTLGYQISVQVPESVQEFDRLAKAEGTCLEQANRNVIYRSVLAEFRSLFCDALESATKISRKTKDTGKVRKVKQEAADGTITETEEAIVVWAETEAEFEDRVVQTLARDENLSPEAIKSRFQALADKLAATLPFDPSESEKTPAGPKKVSAAVTAVAQKIIDAGRAEAVAANLSTKLGIPVEPTLESLARAVAEDQRRKRLEMEKDYV